MSASGRNPEHDKSRNFFAGEQTLTMRHRSKNIESISIPFQTGFAGRNNLADFLPRIKHSGVLAIDMLFPGDKAARRESSARDVAQPPGTVPNDFTFIDCDDARSSLHGLKVQRIMLILYMTCHARDTPARCRQARASRSPPPTSADSIMKYESRLNGGLGMGSHKPSVPRQSDIKLRQRYFQLS